MGKHSKAHICANKPGTDETSEYKGMEGGGGGILVQYASEGVDFSVLHSYCWREAGYSSAAIEKYHGERERQRRRSRGPASVLTGSSTERMSANTEATQLQQDIQDLSTHFAAIIHEKTGIRCSHQSFMIFTRIPWTSFACEEQSLFLFYGLISIKPCCLIRHPAHSFWKSVQNGHCKKKH